MKTSVLLMQLMDLDFIQALNVSVNLNVFVFKFHTLRDDCNTLGTGLRFTKGLTLNLNLQQFKARI